MTKIITATPTSVAYGEKQLGVETTENIEVASSGTEIPTVTGARIVDDETGSFAVGEITQGDLPLMISLMTLWEEKGSNLPKREAFGVTTLGDYIIVLGGKRYDDLLEDCWRSKDGYTWEQVGADCFGGDGRSHFALFAVGTTLVAVGGITAAGVTDEIWTSDDGGETWELSETALATPLARMGYAQDGSALRMYGGIYSTDEYDDPLDSLWSSTDGISWSEDDAQDPGARFDCLLIFKTGGWGGLYLFCGHIGAALIADCWYLDPVDGWDEKTAPFAHGRVAVAGCFSGDYIFIYGGAEAYDDITEAEDTLRVSWDGGAAWTQITDALDPRAYHAFMITPDSSAAVIFGGHSEDAMHEFTLESRATLTVPVLFRPKQIGALSATLLIEGDMDDPVTEIPLTGEGTYPGSVDLIETHETDALARVMYQFKDAANFKAILAGIGKRYQTIEKTAYKLFAAFDIEAMSGDGLDKIGVVLGVYRGGGEEDPDYRRRLYAAIVSGNSMGSMADIVKVCRELLGDESDLLISEIYPAEIEIFLSDDLDEDWSAFRDAVEATLAAGVSLGAVIPFVDDAFGFEEDDTALGFDIGGMIDYYDYAKHL